MGYEVLQGNGSSRVGGIRRIQSDGEFRGVGIDDGEEREKIGAQRGERKLLGGRVCTNGGDGKSAGLSK